MTAWGVVAVCGIGGAVAGPFLDRYARSVRRPPAPPVELAVNAEAATTSFPVPSTDAGDVAAHPPDAVVAPAGMGEPLSQPQATVTPTVGHTQSRVALVFEGVAAAVVTAAFFAAAAVRLGDVPQLAVYCVLGAALVVVSITDLRTGLVPRRVIYAAVLLVGVALLCASAADGTWRPMLDALIGGAIAFFIFGAIWWISPKAMGFGDVRLAGLCGGALGWLGLSALYIGFLAGFVAGICFGLAVLVARGRRRFPFAPSLALGTMFGVLWGVWLGTTWLHFR